MRKSLIGLCLILNAITILSTVNTASAVSAAEAPKMKEWTLLVFLNGNNNLDRFGRLNVNQMEQVGSTADINVVVQWASLSNKKTQRLFITQDQDMNKVTSPVVQDMGNVDMGDWKNLVEFVKWGVANYPAKHYFIDVWDHGSGWHALRARRSNIPQMISPMDISWDDHTGHFITSVQLGLAMTEAAQIIGHKVDIYASDACLMAMVELADELSDSVQVYGGSEEVEAGAGWPYQTILKRWAQQPQSSPAEVGKILTEEFVASYNGGVNGTDDATFSVFDLDKMGEMRDAVSGLKQSLMKIKATEKPKVVSAINQTHNFTYSDYGDLNDFVDQLTAAKVDGLDQQSLATTKAALSAFVIAHAATSSHQRAFGASIWLPNRESLLSSYSDRYRGLKFNQNTSWLEALEYVLK